MLNSVRDLLACNGLTQPATGYLSVVRDVFGFVGPDGATPLLPAILVRNDYDNTSQPLGTLSLIEQLALASGPRFHLNLRPVFRNGTPTAIAAEWWRRANAALYLARQVFGAHSIGIGRVRWYPVPNPSYTDAVVGSGSATAAGKLLALKALQDQHGLKSGLPIDLQHAVNVFLPEAVFGAFGIAGRGSCPPGGWTGAGGILWSAATAGCGVGAKVGSGFGPLGPLLGCFIGALAGAGTTLAVNAEACAVGMQSPHDAGDFQRGKTLAHELGHFFGLALGHVIPPGLDGPGDVMSNGPPDLDYSQPIWTLLSSFSLAGADEIRESPCVLPTCGVS